MKIILIFLICISLVFSNGSLGYREIEDGYIVTSVAFEKTGNEVEMILEVLLPLSTEQTYENMLYGKGENFEKAYVEIQKSLVKSLYFEHCGVIIISNNYTVSETEKIFDFCKNLKLISIDVYAVVTDDLNEIFKTEKSSESLGYDIIELLKNSKFESLKNQFYQIEKQYALGLTPNFPVVNVKNNRLILE